MGRGAAGGGCLLSLGVREALEAGVPGSVQDLPDRWSGSGTGTGRGSWEARPPRVNSHWGGSNISEATVSQLALRPLSNTLVGARTLTTTGVGERVTLQAQAWEGGWPGPWQFAGHRSKTSPGPLWRQSHVAGDRGSLGPGLPCIHHPIIFGKSSCFQSSKT